MRARWFVLLFLLPLAGCVMRSGAPHRHGHADAGADDLEAEQEVAFGVDGAEPKHPRRRAGDELPADPEPPPRLEDDPDRDFSADPHTKRPGTTEVEEAEPSVVTFTAPAATLQPVPRARRPKLPEPATLAVAFVRDGQLAFSAEAVLELEELLLKEAGVKMLASLGPTTLPQAGLPELAAQASEEGWDLLLVDVQSGTSKRVGYLLHTKSGKLLARYDKDAKGVGTTPASTGGASDLCDRLASTYARMTK